MAERGVRRRTFLRGGVPALAALGLAQEPAAAQGAASRLVPPASGPIDAAFLISDGATVIGFAGPWEVFQDVMLPEPGRPGSGARPVPRPAGARSAAWRSRRWRPPGCREA
jgi:hypothetical protein